MRRNPNDVEDMDLEASKTDSKEDLSKKQEALCLSMMNVAELIGWPIFAVAMAILWTFTYIGSIMLIGTLMGALWAVRRSSLRPKHRFPLLLGLAAAGTFFTISAFQHYAIEPNVRGKVMVIYCKEHIFPLGAGLITQGLFSALKHVMGALHYAEANGAAGVRVNFIDKHYSDPEQDTDNYYSYFFEETMLMDKRMTSADASQLEEVHFDQYVKRHGRWGGFNHIMDGPDGSKYPVTYGVDRPTTMLLLDNYIKLKPQVQQKITNLRMKHDLDGADAIVGVHYRGTDTAEHYPFLKISYESFYEESESAIAAILKEKGVDRSKAKVKIFVATDEQEFLDGMITRFGADAVFFHEESPRLTPDQYKAATEGLTNSPDVHIGNYLKGETAIVDAIMLAAGQHLIKGRSNLSDFSWASNVDMKVTLIFGEHDRTELPKIPLKSATHKNGVTPRQPLYLYD